MNDILFYFLNLKNTGVTKATNVMRAYYPDSPRLIRGALSCIVLFGRHITFKQIINYINTL